MRAALPILLALLPLAGCLGVNDAAPEPRSFTALYARPTGEQFTLTFGKVVTTLAADGEVREGYLLALPDSGTGGWAQVLDHELAARRTQRCWILDEPRTGCDHIEVRFGAGAPDHGVAGPLVLRDQVRRQGDLVVVTASEDAWDRYEYEYRPGAIWPERYVKLEGQYDETSGRLVRVAKEQFRLLAVDVGETLPAIDPWPPKREAMGAAPAGAGFPEETERFDPLPFPIAEGLEALAGHEEAGPVLQEGCVGSVMAWETMPVDATASPLSPVFGGSVGEIRFGLVDAEGNASSWAVSKQRGPVLGQEMFEVERDLGSAWLTGYGCADRLAPTLLPSEFLDQVPSELRRGHLELFHGRWAKVGDAEDAARLHYEARWRPEDGDHFRSAVVDATTGEFVRLTFKPGDMGETPY